VKIATDVVDGKVRSAMGRTQRAGTTRKEKTRISFCENGHKPACDMRAHPAVRATGLSQGIAS
jgi:hypothetical protein